MNDTFEVFYTPATQNDRARIIDTVMTRQDGVVVGTYSNKTKEELEATYGKEMLVGKADDISKMIEDGFCVEPEEISEEDWWSALEALPPQDWKTIDGVQSFKFMEYTYGEITSIYAKTSKGCWAFKNRASMTAKEIADKINSLDCKVAA